MPWFTYFSPSRPVRAPGSKSGLAPFPGRMSYKATKPGLAVCHILACFYYYGHCHIIGLKSVWLITHWTQILLHRAFMWWQYLPKATAFWARVWTRTRICQQLSEVVSHHQMRCGRGVHVSVRSGWSVRAVLYSKARVRVRITCSLGQWLINIFLQFQFRKLFSAYRFDNINFLLLSVRSLIWCQHCPWLKYSVELIGRNRITEQDHNPVHVIMPTVGWTWSDADVQSCSVVMTCYMADMV